VAAEKSDARYLQQDLGFSSLKKGKNERSGASALAYTKMGKEKAFSHRGGTRDEVRLRSPHPRKEGKTTRATGYKEKGRRGLSFFPFTIAGVASGESLAFFGEKKNSR